MNNLLERLKNERLAQVVQHSLAEDDAKTPEQWIAVISRHVGLAVDDGGHVSTERFERQIIRIGSLCLAVLESMERKGQLTLTQTTPSDRSAGAFEGSGY
jgi:hypothetical protein